MNASSLDVRLMLCASVLIKLEVAVRVAEFFLFI